MKYPETSKRIRSALEKANMSQQELAELSGVSKSSISHYVNGTNSPSNITAGLMAQVLHCSPVWLMGFDVEATEAPLCSSYDNVVEFVDKASKDDLRRLQGYIEAVIRSRRE